MTDVITGDITVFEPGMQVPYGMTWTGGWQRKVGSSMVVEARYVGTELAAVLADLQLQRSQHRRERVPERVQGGAGQPDGESSPRAAGTRSRTPAWPARRRCRSSSRTSTRFRRPQPATTGSYTGTNWTNTTFLGFLAKYNPAPYNFANTGNDRLIGNNTLRNNAITAGLPVELLAGESGPHRRRQRRRQRRRDLLQLAAARAATSASHRASSSRRATSSPSRTARSGTRCDIRASASRTPAPRVKSRTRSAPTGSTSCRSARGAASRAVSAPG